MVSSSTLGRRSYVKKDPNTVKCKYCKRSKNGTIVWRQKNGRMCRACPRVLSRDPASSKDAKAGTLEDILEEGSDALAAWLIQVEAEERRHAKRRGDCSDDSDGSDNHAPVPPSNVGPARASFCNGTTIREISGVFWPEDVYQRKEGKKLEETDAAYFKDGSGRKRRGQWRYDDGAHLAVGAIVQESHKGSGLVQDMKLWEDDEDDNAYKQKVLEDVSKKMKTDNGMELSNKHKIFDEDLEDSWICY